MLQGHRRLAAIMFTDIVGFTALGHKNESLSLALVEEQRKLIRPVLNRHNGREVKTMGDAFLVEFPSALDAVRCAYDVQRAAREFNISLPQEQRVHLRIGIHLGDVVESEGDISGDAVNVASRIEPLAEDGGVCLTRQVYDHVQNKFELPLRSLGTKSLKNVSTQVEVYRIVLPWDDQPYQATQLDASRVAVLPFASMSPDPNDSYLAEGITEEIISTLSGVSGLSVISRTSIMGYRGTTKKAKEIGSELEVGSILEGSFRKAGNKIRVTAQLIAVNNDRHVWGQSYDRNLDDVFAVQTDIAKRVSDALRVRISAHEMDRIDRKPTENTKAYALYLRGRYHWNKRGLEDTRKAAEYFEQALKEDQTFALGYVGRADCHELLSTNWGIDPTTNHEIARTAVAKALELDEGLAEAHATRGLVLMRDFNLGKAEEELRKAIELKPSYAPAHLWYYQILIGQLRWDEALKHIERAVELDPFSQIINLNHAGYYEGRRDYGRALELYKRAAELQPNFAFAHWSLAWVYARMKNLDDANREAKIAARLIQELYPHAFKAWEAMMAYFEDDKPRVRRLLPELEEHLGEAPGFDATVIAGLYFYLGEVDKGFEMLEQSYLRKEYWLLYIQTQDLLDSIRAEPRYQNLLKKMGLKASLSV